MLKYSNTWINFNYICVAAAFMMLGAALFLMPVDLATKGYLGMGIVFLSGSLVTLVKTLHDIRIEGETSSKLERVKQDKLLQEYVQSS